MCFAAEIELNLKNLSKIFKARIDEKRFGDLRQLQEQNPKRFKTADDHGRIYPNYWAPVLVQKGEVRYLTPMRYRLRPHWSDEEIPNKYNVYNARMDSLQKRKSWKQIFMKRHGVLFARGFYEWSYDVDGKKKLMRYMPEQGGFFNIPCLWDYWKGEGDEIFSFALVTDDPFRKVEGWRFDRAPIVMKEENIDQWLVPQELKIAGVMGMLKDQQAIQFQAASDD